MTSRMKSIAALFFIAGVSPALARISPEQRCQESMASAGRMHLERALGILASCRAAAARGALPAGTECLDRPEIARKLAKAARGPGRRIRRACANVDLGTLAPAGECAGAKTVDALVDCVRVSHQAEAEDLSAITNPGGRIDARTRRCTSLASRQARRLASFRLRSVQRCKSAPDSYDLPAGADCTAAAGVVGRTDTVRAKAAARIAAACDAGVLAGRPLGAPCDGARTGTDAASCVLDAATAAADGAVTSEYRDRGICGDTATAVEARVDGLLAQMTLEEKVAQMTGSGPLPVDGTYRTPPLERLGIPGFAMVDGPRGVGDYAGHATAFPVGSARGATWDPDLEAQVGNAIGEEVRAKGGSVLLAPTINILRHPRWGRAQETYGEDTVHLGWMGAGFISGVQRQIIANAKHYAANSIENTRFVADVIVDQRTLREVYLPHFRVAVEQAHVGSVMSAYNQVNGQYCSENVHLLHDVLKNDWAFQGFVESDWTIAVRSTAPSANAGLDIEMPSAQFYGQKLANAVTAGTVAPAVIDEAVRRILRTQFCFRLDSDPPRADATKIEKPAHLDVALEAEREAIVLLRNDGAALPIDHTAIRSLVVIGALAAVPNIGDHGSSDVAPNFVVTPLDGIRSHAGGVTVTYVAGPTLSPDEQAAVAAADAAVIVAGLTSADEGEGLITIGDRRSLALPAGQDDLIRAIGALNRRTIVVLEGSGALTMPWLSDVAAVIMAWYPGQRGGDAIAEVLFGDVNPSGKLPVTFPVAEADLPRFDNVSSTVSYGYFHGYRWIDQRGIAPLFPFGFGLSYTTFRYANLRLDAATIPSRGRVRITADVTNAGAVAGDEIAQLYVSYRGSRVERAVRDLKGFARVHLEPGETRTVAFTLRAADLAFWDVGAGGWEVEPIEYGVEVGPSSRDLPLEGSFRVDG